MKAISFLGTTDYKNTSYKFSNDQIFNTLYFPYAVNRFYNPDEHYILMTKEAKHKHCEKLSELFKFHEVIIPIGKDEHQFWEIFDIIMECIDSYDEIILDFTYGFRSQPVLAIAALIYLKELKNIKIKNVIYGAFEAKENEVVPVFDMVSFIELIDWSYAVRDFLKYGKSSEINKLLRDIQKFTHTIDVGNKAKGLSNSGRTLNNLSKALSVVNTKEAFRFAHDFANQIENLIEDFINIKKTKPIGLILGEIVKRIEPISSAEKNLFSDKGIQAQLNIIEWYLETEQYQQAITMMNELFISINCILKKLDPLKLENRNFISKEFGEKIQKFKNEELEKQSKDEVVLRTRLSEIRNEINHAGFKENISNAETQINNIKDIHKDLKIYIKEELKDVN